MKLLFLLLACSLSLSLFAYDRDEHHYEEHHSDNLEFEVHTAHVHGQASANISYINDTLIVELKMASRDVFGFEHLPKNEQEIDHVISTLLFLEQTENVFTLHTSCEHVKATVDSDILPMRELELSSDDEHTDVTAVYTLHCKSDINLTFALFKKFTSLEKISIQYVSSSEQLLLSATRENNILKLNN